MTPDPATPATPATSDGGPRGTGDSARPPASDLAADILVVGAGPAGIAAACRAAEAGARVVLVDEAAAPGGQIWRTDVTRDAPDGLAALWLGRLAACGARWIGGTAVVDALPGPVLLVDGPRGARRLAAPRLVIATGAREIFLPFPGWTLPNVVGVGGAQALLKSGAVMRGRRAVVAGSGPLLLPVAAALAQAGVRVALVAEQAPAGAVARFAAGLVHRPRLLAQAARYRAAFRPAPYRCGVWVREARGAPSGGEATIRGVRGAQGTRGGPGGAGAAGRETRTGPGAAGSTVREVVLTDGRRSWSVPCDLLACAFGLVPNLELPRLLGCALDGGGGMPRVVSVDAWQQTSVPGVHCAGELTGVGGLELALLSGQIAGLAAALGCMAPDAGGSGGSGGGHDGGGGSDDGRNGRGRGGGAPGSSRPVDSSTTATAIAHELRRLFRARDRERRHVAALGRAFRLRAELRQLAAPDTLVCRCEDVALGRLDPAWTPRQAKLHTRVGMGPCQGRVCAPALEFLFGWDEPDSVRPPLQPVALATLAGLCAAPPATDHGVTTTSRGD